MNENPAKVKVTLQQIANFRTNARNYLSKQPSPDASKLAYALGKMIKATDKIHAGYVDDENEARVELATADSDGNLKQDKETGYSYTKENATKLQKKLRELGSKEVEVDPYYATIIPKKLEPVWLEFFVPFVIREEREEKEEKEEEPAQ